MIELTLDKPFGFGKDEIQRAFDDLAADLFWSYYAVEPEQLSVPKDQLPTERKFTGMLIDWLRQTQTWQAGHERTAGSLVHSALTANRMWSLLTDDDLIRQMLQNMAESAELDKQAAKKERSENKNSDSESDSSPSQSDGDGQDGDGQDGDGQDGDGDGDGDSDGQDGDSDNQSQQPKASSQELRKRANSKAAKAQQMFDKLTQSKHNEAFRAGFAQQAKTDASDSMEVLASWGVELDKIQPNDIGKIQNLLNRGTFERLSGMVELFGRAKGFAISGRIKSAERRGFVVVQDGFTQDIASIFPSERSMLMSSNPLLQAQATCEYADHGLMGMVKGHDTDKLGSLVIAVDSSGSMGTPVHLDINDDGFGRQATRHQSGSYSAEEVSKGLSLAITKAAKTFEQYYHMFLFGCGSGYDFVNSSTSDLDTLSWAGKQYGGGTDFDSALTKCVDIINNDVPEAERNNADVLFITDGQANISESVAEQLKNLKENRGTRFILMYIGSGISQVKHQFRHIFDAYIDVCSIPSFDDLSRQVTDALR